MSKFDEAKRRRQAQAIAEAAERGRKKRESGTYTSAPRRGPHGRGVPGEKARDFKGSIGKLVSYLGGYNGRSSW